MYTTEVLARATARLAGLRADHESQANARQAEVYRKLPRVQAIDKEMQQNMIEAAFAAFESGQDAMAEAKAKNQALAAEREALLAQSFGADFLNDAPFCNNCGGSGYLGSAMCDCLKKLCIEEQQKELGPILTRGECFENFRLDYYSEKRNPQYGAAPRTIMEKVLRSAREYARSFSPKSSHLLFAGGTGLGKTHLALSIGRSVGLMGYSVCYETSGSLFTKLEQAKFYSTEENRREAEMLEKCDLLILDDLGTEMPGQFVTAALYSLLNTRLLEGRPMIITTNLNVEETAKRYSPQISSRLYGDFVRLTFVGDDVRILRSRGVK